MVSKNLLKYYSIFVTFLVMLFFVLSFTTNAKAAVHDVNLTTTALPYITLDITSNDLVNFGNITPASPIAAPSGGSVASVSTNAANGYTLGVSDGSDTNSALRHTDTTTYIADYAGTLTAPTAWTGTGLGMTLFAADSNKEVKWGTGTTYNDALNKYAGVPNTATTAHTVTGALSGADTSSWAFKLDIPNAQKTGDYSGNITFTATAVLS